MKSSALCPCGTGLRLLRCCKLDIASLPTDASSSILDSLSAEAQRRFKDKELAAGESLVLQLLDLAPHHEGALQLLFRLRTSEGKSTAAEALARRIAQLPVSPPRIAANNLQCAKLLIDTSRWAEAEPYVKTALRMEPADATAHQYMAVLLTATKRLEAGERHFHRALDRLGHEDGVMLGNLAWNLFWQGRLDDAAAAFERALAQRQQNLRALQGQALVETARGNRARAAGILDEILSLQPANQPALLSRARLDLIENAPQRAVARLDGNLTTADALVIAGEAYARQGQIPQALSAFDDAKRRRPAAGRTYDAARYASLAARCKETFGASRVPPLPAEYDPDPFRLVFVLGFPRSGTTLLEQMLAKIPGVAAADNLGSIPDLADLATRLQGNVGYPELVFDLAHGSGPRIAAQLRREYFYRFKAAGLVRPDTRFITVRDPVNDWHLGLIQRLFPEALLIHCLRHPLDVMASSLAEVRMLDGNCNSSLRTLAQHYDMSMALVQHYRAHLTLYYTAVRYEELVTAPWVALQRLAAFMGVNAADIPEESQLRATAITASPRAPNHQLWQEPIHTHGLNRHRAYELAAPDLFKDVRPMLKPWIDALGYAP